MSITTPEPIPVAGVDGGTETWHRVDGRFPVCGCPIPELPAPERADWMVCQLCALPVLDVMLRGRQSSTP